MCYVLDTALALTIACQTMRKVKDANFVYAIKMPI